MLSPELTSWLNSGVILALLIWFETLGLRKYGLQNMVAVAKHGSATDHVGHLAGYATGVTTGALIRAYDPRWQGLERHRFWDWYTKSRAKSQNE